MYSVDNEEEARNLLVAACPTIKDGPLKGEFVARELHQEQTLENLEAFGERLAQIHQHMKSRDED